MLAEWLMKLRIREAKERGFAEGFAEAYAEAYAKDCPERYAEGYAKGQQIIRAVKKLRREGETLKQTIDRLVALSSSLR